MLPLALGHRGRPSHIAAGWLGLSGLGGPVRRACRRARQVPRQVTELGRKQGTGHGGGSLTEPKPKAWCLPQSIHLEGGTGSGCHNRQESMPWLPKGPGGWSKAETHRHVAGALLLREKPVGSRVPEVPSHGQEPGSRRKQHAATSPELTTGSLAVPLGS